jgi:hypothetical protein
MEWPGKVFHYFVDAKNKVSSKIMAAFIVLVIFILFDNTIGFSYYFSSGKKVSQISELNHVIRSTPDSGIRSKLITLQNNIIERRSLKDKFVNIFYSTHLPTRRLSAMQVIGSAWLIALLLTIVSLGVLFDPDLSLGKRLLGSLFFIFFTACLASIYLWLRSLIPPITEGPVAVFSVNLFCQVFFIIVVALLLDPRVLQDAITKGLTNTKDQTKHSPPS